MFAVVRIRGSVGVDIRLKDTLRLLSLTRVNHLVLLAENTSTKKMIEKVQGYLTYGEVDEKVVEALLTKRARLPGNKKLTAEFLKEHGFKSFKELGNALMSGKKSLKDLQIKKVFRLSPPRKGFERKGIKRSFKEGGSLGYRGKEINKIVMKMV